MVARGPETILIFAANPTDQPQLRLDYEVREIYRGLRNSRKRFALQQLWAPTRQDLWQALLDYKPAYVHFCGHGTGTSGIVLEDQLVDAEALANLFGLFPPRCVVLNACFSSTQAHAIVKHVDYVVGMSEAIGDDAAIEFSAAFYEALGAGEAVEVAFGLGRTAIQLAGIQEHLTPQLLIRSPDGTGTQVAPPASRPRTSHEDWDGAPTVSQLFGRDADAELLRTWILQDACRMVLITGLGGVGKTDLVTCLGRGGNQSEGTSSTLAAGIQGDFETVIWRKLLDAPLPDELFGDLADFLSEHRRAPADSVSQQIDEIIRCLQERRCLVILDNVETVLRPGDPQMRYRPGYEAYGTFFEQVARSPHQSCLLLTSREKPRSISDFEGARKPVRSLSLGGIGVPEAQALFGQIGTFTGSAADWERIVRLYNGNPLALDLVARHIEMVFLGDLGAFLGAGRAVFADLQELLDWHFDRLSREETELVYWLAISREPVSLVTLHDDIVSPVSRQNTTSTLQSLQRRIPLERSGSGGFTLQPVLIEHVTERLVNEIVADLDAALSEVRWRERHPAAAPPALSQGLSFNSYALIKATAKENVRESQRRLILSPVAERIMAAHGSGLKEAIAGLLEVWRGHRSRDFGYAAGNLINLLSRLDVELNGLSFSRLPVWQACLHDVNVRSSDFSFCGFRHSTFKHPVGTVFALGYSPEGGSIAVGDDNGDIIVFRAGDGEFERRCVGHADVIWSVVFSPDGNTMASASFDNTIRIWSTRDGRCLNVLMGHRGWIYDLAFSTDGKTLASVSEDGTCRLWDLRSGRWVSPAVEEPGFLSSVAFSPDGQRLAVAGKSGVVNLFRVSDLESPQRLVLHTSRVSDLIFSPDGELLASGGGEQIHLWRSEDGAYLGTLTGHAGGITSLSFSSAGDLLASASVDPTVRLWSMVRMECVGQIRVGSARVWVAQCSPTDRTLTTASEDGAVRVWNMDSCECLVTLRGYSNKTWSLAFSPNRSLLFAGNDDALVRGWDVREARPAVELPGHASRVWAVACSPDGQWAASGSDDLSVRLWDLRSGTCRHVLQGHTDWVRALAFDPGSGLLASAAEDGRVIIWDVERGHAVTQIEGGIPRVLVAVAFCQDGQCVAVGGAGNAVHLFSSTDGSRLGEMEGHEAWITTLVSHGPAGSMLASCGEDGLVKIWNMDRRECTATLQVGDKVWCGAFCDGGESFVTGSDGGQLRRWSIRGGRCEAQTRLPQGTVWALAVNPAEDTVATAGNDGSIRLWRLPEIIPYAGLGTLRPPRPYEGMNISGATGLAPAQREALLALGALSF